MLSLITLLLMHLKCDSDLLCHAVCSLYHLIRKRVVYNVGMGVCTCVYGWFWGWDGI